jgi:Domain of unknown function (DUF4937
VLAKWIVCRVSGSNRPAFSAAQQKWSRIAGCNGFIGQFGGFCGKHAHVIGLCSKRDLYEQFMQRDHGAIALAAEPSGRSKGNPIAFLFRRCGEAKASTAPI